MTLTLQVNDHHGLLPKADAQRSLESGRLTIGRGQENDWVLPDPERVISKQHCVIEAVSGGYTLTDTSSNGAYVNTKDQPVGRGKSVALNDGDRILLSHFEIQVTLAEGSAMAPSPSQDPVEPAFEGDLDSLFGSEAPSNSPADDALDALLAGSSSPASQDDPFGEAVNDVIPDDSFALSATSDPEADLGYDGPPMADQVPASEELFAMPEAAPVSDSQIPEDWFLEESSGEEAGPSEADDPFSGPATPIPAAVPPAAAPPAQDPPRPAAIPAPIAPAAAPQIPPQDAPQAAVAAPTPASQAAALQAFLAGAGLDDLQIPEDKAAEVMESLGQIYREVVRGLMEVLAARSSIKNEFRLSQTMIQPVENNPLKFSLSVDDAMATMLTKSGRGYLPPLKAVEEAFEDVKAHQVAVLAGMQQALNGLLERFDPKSLEQRIEGDKGIGSLLTGKKARYWDAFSGLYDKISAEAEDDFQSIFGREFGKAYEAQVRKHGRRGG